MRIGEGPERDPVAVRETAPGQAQRLRLFATEPLPELPHQPRLADARVAQHRQQHRLRPVDRSPERDAEPLQLGVAPDKGTGEVTDPARAHQRKRTHDRSATKPALLPFRLDGARLAEFERAARGRDRALTDENLAGLRRLFQSRGDVHRVAADERAAGTRRPRNHLAGVHADPQGEPALDLPLHRKGSVECAFGVILERLWGSEGGHHGIAGELLDRPAGSRDLLGHRVVEPLQPSAGPFGILVVCQSSRSGEIGEQDGGELAL